MWGFWPSPGPERSRLPEGDRDEVLCRNYTGTGADERGEETSEFCHSWDVFTPLEGAAGHRSVPAAGWKVDGEEVPQLHWLLSLLLLQCSSVGGKYRGTRVTHLGIQEGTPPYGKWRDVLTVVSPARTAS